MSEEISIATEPYRVLIVDDEPDARDLIGIALGSKGFELQFAINGREALECCAGGFPDLIVLDVQMPELDGLEVCRRIKKDSGANFVPVLLLTAQSEDSQVVHGLECGADDYITKPFSLAELSARVEAFLRIKVLTDQLRKTQNLLEQKEKELVAMQVAGAAAHALGQPLTSIILNCELLSAIQEGSSDFRSAISEITGECKRVKDILDALNSLKSYKLTSYVSDIDILDLNPEPELN